MYDLLGVLCCTLSVLGNLVSAEFTNAPGPV